MSWYRALAVVTLMSGALALSGSNVGALPLTAGAKQIASGAEDQATPVAAHGARRFGPSMGGSRMVGPRFVHPRPFVRRGTRVIIGISPVLPYYYDYGPYYYEPYTYETPYDADAIAYCTRRFRSFDVRTMTYLGFDGLRHPCP